MPAKSKAQQRFFGAVRAAQKGEKPASKKVAKVARSMDPEDVEDFAKTKHRGKPERVKKEQLQKMIREIIRELLDIENKMKITKSKLKEIIREELLQERSDIDLKDLISQIDWKALESEIKKRIRTNVTLTTEIYKDRIRFSSKNIANKAGIFASVFSEVYIDTFGSDITSDKKHYYFRIHLSWEYKDGGTNGTNIFLAYWDISNKKWIFK